MAALHQADLSLFARSIGDALVEPIRAPLVPGYTMVKQAALEAGALGCSISGSGPSVLAFADSDALADHVATAIESGFARHSLASNRYVGPVNGVGAQVE